MIKEIRYGGFSAQPSDYECADGELAQAVNFINEDGVLKPIFPPKPILALGVGQSVRYIHATSSYTHYIITPAAGPGFVLWYDKAGGAITTAFDDDEITALSFNAIGNTLMIFTETDIHYLFWTDDRYIYLGNKLPDADISFGLVGHPRLFSVSDEEENTFSVTLKNDDGTVGEEFTDDTKTLVTSVVMAKLNKFIAAQSVGAGRQCFPFFVRYALRLYDGTLTSHSAPILMMPGAPIVMTNPDGRNGKTIGTYCDIMLVAADIDYQIKSEIYKLQHWSDIITSIDVFISKPIYTYDQSGQCDMFCEPDYSSYHHAFVGSLYGADQPMVAESEEDRITSANGFIGNITTDIYAEWDYNSLYNMYFKATNKTYFSNTRIHLQEYTEEKMADQYLSTSNFYLLESIRVEDLTSQQASERTVIEVADDYLQSLTSREAMTDDYLSHDRLSAGYSFTYNQRLSLSGVVRYPYQGYSPASMFSFRNAAAWLNLGYDTTGLDDTDGITSSTPTYYYVRYEGIDDDPNADNTNPDYSSLYNPGETSIDVYLNDNSTPVRVSSQYYSDTQLQNLARFFYAAKVYDRNKASTYDCPNFFGCYVFYPNVNATRMVIGNDNLGFYDIKLQAHDYLNGAVAYIPATTIRTPAVDYPADSKTYKTSIELPNKIYTSEISNPFYFPVTNINTIGTGTIMALSTAAKALSEGQFGQFPLYAFSTDGVWALEVSSTGGFSAKQPITRDVCLSSESVTQIDSAVLFATQRGIMLLSGSASQCLSDTLINTGTQSVVADMSSGAEILSIAGISPEQTTIVPFKTFIQTCRMIYDYVNQRIIVYSPMHAYAYVYSLKTRLWGMMQSAIASSVNSYPDAFAMDKSGNLVDFSLSEAETVNGLIVTRPLKLDAPGVLKTVNSIIQRGEFRKRHVRVILQGSRDLITWLNIFSSEDHYLRGFHGTPYKYFRLVLLCSLESGENIYGCTVQYEPRLTNRPR